MDKHLILEKYRNSEEKLLISKLFDKIEMVNIPIIGKVTAGIPILSNENVLKNFFNIIKFENFFFLVALIIQIEKQLLYIQKK